MEKKIGRKVDPRPRRKNRIKLAHTMTSLENFFCLSGPYYFSPDNHNGTGEWAVAITKVVNGKMVLEK